MVRYINIAVFIFLSQMCTAQVMMLFSQDSLTGIVSPLDVDSLFYWFAADVGVTDSLGGAIATDEGVGTWNDLSGSGHHVTQSTDGARPVWKATGGPGSKPCIQFDGSNDFLASAAHWWGSDDLTVFVVMKWASATADLTETIVSRLDFAANAQQWILTSNNASASYSIRTFRSSTGINSGGISFPSKSATYRIINVDMVAGAATYHAWIDSSPVSTTPIGSSVTSIYDASQPIVIGSVGAVGSYTDWLQGSISEIIVFSRALTATERTAIENYLNRKYDLY